MSYIHARVQDMRTERTSLELHKRGALAPGNLQCRGQGNK